MRMRLQALKSCSDTPLHITKHLDLSDKGIVAIEGLHHCPLLESLVLRCNYIDMLCNLDCCRNLWQLDLTGNRVKSLIGIGQFPSLGGLHLAYNDLNWREVNRLHHMHILRLTLIGNPQLNCDPNYRYHVISMLPHVWMLDGLLITAGERSKVIKFFYTSKNSTRPVWCKSSHDNFTPSTMKNLFVKGKFGPKTAHMMQQFPIHCVHTAELDWRRLGYLGNSMEEQLHLEAKTKLPLLRLILDSRHGNERVDQCNMLLLLLLAALKYKLPAVTMAAAYSTAKLEQLWSGVKHIEKLPSTVQLQLVSLLLSAVAIDRDTKSNRVLSCVLLNSVMSTFQTVHREIQAKHANRRTDVKKSEDDKFNESVLAAEVVQIFCLVPTFIDTLINQSHPGVIRLVAMATKNSEVMEIVATIATSSPHDKQQQNVASYLMDIVQHNVLLRKRNQVTKPKQRRHSTPTMRGCDNTTLYTTRVKSAGNMTRCKSISDVKDGVAIATGDIVLLGDQGMVAKVISEQENHSVLLQTVSEMKNRYFYVNVQNLRWNHANGCWETDVRWLDSSVDIRTHSTQSIISDDEVFTGCYSNGSINHGNNSSEHEVAMGNRKISLIVDMSDKSAHDITETMEHTMETTDRAKSPDMPTSPLQTVWECNSSVSSKVDLSADYRIMQRQQLKNNDVHLVEPHPPPTSPTYPSHTPVIVQNAWGPLHHQSAMTKHTLTSYNRLLYCRKQQQRPIKSTRSGGAIILQQSQSQPMAASYPNRMPIHQATKSLLSVKPFWWRSPPTSTVPPSTRKLGNILTIDGSSLLS